jgi:Flp pilus assembly pilin Flp
MSPDHRGRAAFLAEESGATMLEYGLLLVLIVLVVAGVAQLLGQKVLPLFQITRYFQ